MINWFLYNKTRNLTNSKVTLQDIEKSRKVLFAIFTRYGDTIINLIVIQEFIRKYNDKDYLILCPKQMKPYVNELIPSIECKVINKRNWIEMFKLDLFLKKWNPDIGFNPWSSGLESSYFLSYCKKYFLYKAFAKPEVINHYQVVRRYLKLNEKEWEIKKLNLSLNYKEILICPESTDNERSISNFQLDQIIKKIKLDYKSPVITIASMRSNYFRDNMKSFYFKKNAISSQNFIKLIKDSDLIICADSAPLHLANALKKEVIAVFNSTSPEIVLNAGDKLVLYENQYE